MPSDPLRDVQLLVGEMKAAETKKNNNLKTLKP